MTTFTILNQKIRKQDLENFTRYLYIHRQKDRNVEKMTKVVNKKPNFKPCFRKEKGSIMTKQKVKNKKKKIGTCMLWGKKVDIYGHQKCKNGATFSVLVKVYPNICNNYQEYGWQIYGIKNVEIKEGVE